MATGLAPWWQGLLCDPQTSGGLLVAVAPEAAKSVLDIVQRAGFDRAAIIGRVDEGTPAVSVEG